MKHAFAGMGLALILFVHPPLPAAAGSAVDAPRALLSTSALATTRIVQIQYLNLPPRIRRLPRALRMRPRPPHMRQRLVPPRAFAPALPRRAVRNRPPSNSAVTVRPSEALRLAQRRWPDSIGLSVRLLRQEPPMYVVKLRTRSRVVRVLVDARSGRVLP